MLAAGLTLDLDDPYPLTSADIAAIQTFEAGALLLGDDAALAFTRLLGNAAARVAEAAVEIFALQVAVGLDAETSELEHSQASAELAALTQLVPDAFDDLLHQHLRRSVRRSLEAAVEDEPTACTRPSVSLTWSVPPPGPGVSPRSSWPVRWCSSRPRRSTSPVPTAAGS